MRNFLKMNKNEINAQMEQLKNKVIEIENEVRYYEEQQYLDCCDYSGQIDTLLKLRKKIIDRYVIDNIDKFIDKICEFDERLTDAFRADFEKRKNIMNDVENVLGDSKELEFSLFLAEDATQKPFDLQSFFLRWLICTIRDRVCKKF